MPGAEKSTTVFMEPLIRFRHSNWRRNAFSRCSVNISQTIYVFSFASSAAYTPCYVFYEEKTDIHARLLHGYFLVSFFNYRFYEFKFSLRIFTVIINPVPERIDSINSHTIGVLSPVLGILSFPHNRNIVCHIYIIRVNVNIISFIRLTAPDTTFLQHQFVHWS